MENEKLDLEDFLNEELLGIKPKKVEKKKKKKLEWKNADASEILEAEEKEKKDKSEVEYTDDENTRTGEKDSSDPKLGNNKKNDDGSLKIKPDKPNHTPRGKKVMEVTLELSGQDYGTVDIGDEEYASITGLSSLLSFFNVNPEKLKDSTTSVESLTLTAEETISQTGNVVTLTMRKNENDGTISINVLVNELGQPEDNMEQAVTYFNNVYQTNILNVINREVRG